MAEFKEVTVKPFSKDKGSFPVEAKIREGKLVLDVKIKGTRPVTQLLRVNGHFHPKGGGDPVRLSSQNIPFDRIHLEQPLNTQVQRALSLWFNNHPDLYDAKLRR